MPGLVERSGGRCSSGCCQRPETLAGPLVVGGFFNGSNVKAVSSMRLRVSSRGEQKQSPLPKLGFGPFVVKTSFGASTIANTEAAMRYVRSVGPSYRTTYHWKVAERMLEVAWTSAEAEEFAAQAFKIALQTDGWLIE